MFDEDGRVAHIFGVSRNVTRLKHAQVQAEAASAAKTAFLANMSHELRTPMNGISGAIELLEQCDDASERRELCSIIRSSLDSMTRQTNDILEFSQLEKGQLQLRQECMQISVVADEVCAQLEPLRRQYNVNLCCNIDPNIPHSLVGDSERLKQILLNLVSNGIKFSPEGDVCLNIDLIKLRPEQAHIRVRVEDTGIGIASDQQQHLFEPFTQVDYSTTRQTSGNGLGLAICRDLVEAKGGSISVRSAPGQGSTFEVLLAYDLAEGVRQQLQPVAKPLPTNLNGHVLLVEDNKTNQLVTSKILQRAGLTVTQAHHGQQAIDRCCRQRFDLILMDWHMPVMDGLRATQVIRRLDNYYQTVPVLGLTARGLAEDRNACIAAGMNDVLVKPLNAIKLINQVQRLLSEAEMMCSKASPNGAA